MTVLEDIQAAAQAVLKEKGRHERPAHLYFGETDFKNHGEALQAIGEVTIFHGNPTAYAVTFPSEHEMWRRVRALEEQNNVR